jgi:hypothetical protein
MTCSLGVSLCSFRDTRRYRQKSLFCRYFKALGYSVSAAKCRQMSSLLAPLLPKSSGVFWILSQRGEAQEEANLYQFFALSLDNLILSLINVNTQAHPVQGVLRERQTRREAGLD